MIEISVSTGTKQIAITQFAALEGWDIQRKFLDFAATNDSGFRKQFIMEVLSFAKVLTPTGELPLSTYALIDNHLQTWQNIEKVFEGILKANGIDPKTHADKSSYWSAAGAEMAISFIAEASKLMGPAFKIVAETANQE